MEFRQLRRGVEMSNLPCQLMTELTRRYNQDKVSNKMKNMSGGDLFTFIKLYNALKIKIKK